MTARRRWSRRAATAMMAASLLGCLPEETTRTARSTLVIGVDVSGSFRGHYNDAIDFAAHYLYGHLNGLGELKVPSAVFVGSVGGEQPGQAKSFQPIHAFQGKTVEQIAQQLRNLFPPQDSFTDFNVFFDRVATLVKRQGLILAPLDIVVLTDGVQDVTGNTTADARSDVYEKIKVTPLEFLSRSVTVRLLYPSPTVAVNWERRVDRGRVRMWTVDAPVMAGWREQVEAQTPPEAQQDLWKWVEDNVDFRVRTRRL
jgi:hypothetical protein